MGSAELRDTGAEGVCEMMSAEQEGEPSESVPASVEMHDDGLEGRELAAVLEALLFVSPEPVTVSLQPLPDPIEIAPSSAAPTAQAERAAIVGVWAPDAGTCSVRDFRDGVLPTVITNEGAWAGEAFCIFTKRTEIDKGWRAVAKCSTPRETWTAHVRLKINDNRLVWTSERGTQAYSRCGPDVLLAAR